MRRIPPLFAIEDLPLALSYIGGLFGIGSVGFIDSYTIYLFSNYGLLLLVLIIASLPIFPYLKKHYGDSKLLLIIKMIFACLILVVSMAYLVDAGYNPFLYFRF